MRGLYTDPVWERHSGRQPILEGIWIPALRQIRYVRVSEYSLTPQPTQV